MFLDALDRCFDELGLIAHGPALDSTPVRLDDAALRNALAQFDVATAIWALGLAIVTTFVAGLYPAWRIGRVPPTVYLKSQ